MHMILRYAWPGNVRELKNVIERIVVTCSEQEVGPDHLPSRLREAPEKRDGFTVKPGASIEAVERMLIAETLAHVTSNRREAAGVLGISVRTLQYKLKKYGLP